MKDQIGFQETTINNLPCCFSQRARCSWNVLLRLMPINEVSERFMLKMEAYVGFNTRLIKGLTFRFANAARCTNAGAFVILPSAYSAPGLESLGTRLSFLTRTA